MISQRSVDEIKEAARERLPEIIGDYVSLEKGSKGSWVGICPFHKEKTGSFNVNPRGFYHCFGCGAAGDAVKFVRTMTGKSYPGALRFIAQRLGIYIFEDDGTPLSPEEIREKEERQAALDIFDQTAEFYHQLLLAPEGEEVRAYLAARCLDAHIIDSYRLGYAPAEWTRLTTYLTGKEALAEVLGLIKENSRGGYYDSMRGRVVFPITDKHGHVIALGGRTLLDEKPKYLNSPESSIYKKSNVLYGLNMAKEAILSTGVALIVEGYMDQINLWRLGIRNVVATCGTALTDKQMRLLVLCGARRVEFLYDGDDAGRAATRRGIVVAQDVGVESMVRMFNAEGFDPGDIRRADEMPPAVIAEEFLFRSTLSGQKTMERLGLLEAALVHVLQSPLCAREALTGADAFANLLPGNFDGSGPGSELDNRGGCNGTGASRGSVVFNKL